MTGSLATGGRADPDGAAATMGGASADAAAGAATGGAGGTAFAGGVDDDDAGAGALDGVAVDAFGVPLALALDFALDLPRPLPGIFGGGTPGMPPGGTDFRYRQLLP